MYLNINSKKFCSYLLLKTFFPKLGRGAKIFFRISYFFQQKGSIEEKTVPLVPLFYYCPQVDS